MNNLFNILITTIGGNEATTSDWVGHVLFIVNTVPECGFTDQCDDPQGPSGELAPRSFFVLDFPRNRSGEQEPGSVEEIKQSCQCEFGVVFPLFQKMEVNSDSVHPLYKPLKETPDADDETGGVEWNFKKFVVSPEEEIIGRFCSRVSPDDDVLRDLIEENLPI